MFQERKFVNGAQQISEGLVRSVGKGKHNGVAVQLTGGVQVRRARGHHYEGGRTRDEGITPSVAKPGRLARLMTADGQSQNTIPC